MFFVHVCIYTESTHYECDMSGGHSIPGFEVIKTFSCSTQLSVIFYLLKISK